MSDDEETDIYGDLPNFQLDEALKALEEDKLHLQRKVEELGTQLDEMKKENERLVAKVKSLGKNISCLYKTAQRELERKEQIITDLRKERDDLLFRRGMRDMQTSENKRSNRKQLTPTKKIRNGNIKRNTDSKIKTNVCKQENSSPFAKDFAPIKKEIPEKCISPGNPEVTKKVIEVTDITNKEVSKTECNSKEEAEKKRSCPEKSQANANNEQISAVAEDSILKTPSVEKFTVHSSSEDCGFGRRRKIKRVIKGVISLSASSTPVRSAAEGEFSSPIDEQPLAPKRICLENDISFNNSVGKMPDANNSLHAEVDLQNSSISGKESASECLQNECAAVNSKCSSSKDSNAPQKESDSLWSELDEQAEEGENKKVPQEKEDGSKTRDVHRNSPCTVPKVCEVNVNVSANLRNPSIQFQLDSASPKAVAHTTIELKTATSDIVEEYKLSNIEFEVKENRPLSSNASSSPSSHSSDRGLFSQTDRSPNGGQCKRSRSWERERMVQYSSPNHSQDSERRTRYSDRDSYRERNRRESYHCRDHRSNRISNGNGDDRMRRSERDQDLSGGRDPRGDRNYRRSRNCDDRYRNSEQMRHRDDDDMRDSGKYGRQLSRDRRTMDSSRRKTSSRSHRHGTWSGQVGSRAEPDERERIGNRYHNKSDSCSRLEALEPKQISLQTDDHLKTNITPPTEWD